MKKDSILIGIVGVLLGVVLTGFAAGAAVNGSNTAMMKVMGMDTAKVRQVATSHSDMTMNEMNDQLKNKTGDDFDKAFIEMMISHHDGAVAMAELAKTNSKHEEVRRLGDEIVAAQSSEIAQMKQWQKSWGYGSDETMQMMHGGH